MKKVFNFFLMSCLLATMCFMAGCDKKNDSGGNGNDNNNNGDNNSGQTIPDPPGTITANIADGSTIQITIPFAEEHIMFYGISWIKPDNFRLWAYANYNSNTPPLISICNLGLMNGLGNITKIPTSGFTVPVSNDNSVACEKGHGYMIKCEVRENYWQVNKTIYVRLYVVETIISTSGGIMGAKVKYQYPFEP